MTPDHWEPQDTSTCTGAEKSPPNLLTGIEFVSGGAEKVG